MEPRTRFTHIINPVHKPPEHELSIAQPVTFESINVAKNHLRDTTGDLVQTICAVYDEDLHLVPDFCDEVVLWLGVSGECRVASCAGTIA